MKDESDLGHVVQPKALCTKCNGTYDGRVHWSEEVDEIPEYFDPPVVRLWLSKGCPESDRDLIYKTWTQMGFYLVSLRKRIYGLKKEILDLREERDRFAKTVVDYANRETGNGDS